MYKFPTIPFPPLRIHTSCEPAIVVGVKGEICRMNRKTFKIIGEHQTPFPSQIVGSTICDGLFVGTWIQFELEQARMASINIDNEPSKGISKSNLRKSKFDTQIDTSVAGSSWCHILDSQPLGITSNENMICFALFKKGIYCINKDSNEIWRKEEINWVKDEMIENSQIIESVCNGPHPNKKGESCVWVWSLGGYWAAIEWEDGTTISKGVIKTKGQVDNVISNEKGSWLISLADGNIVQWNMFDDSEQTIKGGPFNDALFIRESWHIAGWREDIIWNNQRVERTPRKELSQSIFNHERGLMILDNGGEWSLFGQINSS
ncbi:MAG: hypothetical protein CMO20_05590 [Thermoplasmata archaeon]|nr:hypothetical protein [Thermoplasmata archaeon]